MYDSKDKNAKSNDTKDVWLKDLDIPQAEIDTVNAVLEEASKQDPRWEKLIWKGGGTSKILI
jgi:hypothetical protein